MLTNNFINLERCVMLGRGFSKPSLLKFKSTDGTEYYMEPFYQQDYPAVDPTSNFTDIRTSSGWAFGTGNTPASVTDYMLESILNLSSSVSRSASVTPVNDTTNNKSIKRCTLTLTNTSANDITINEMGLIGNIRGNVSITVGGNERYALFFRHVFDEPIVILPTEAISIIVDFSVDV